MTLPRAVMRFVHSLLFTRAKAARHRKACKHIWSSHSRVRWVRDNTAFIQTGSIVSTAKEIVRKHQSLAFSRPALDLTGLIAYIHMSLALCTGFSGLKAVPALVLPGQEMASRSPRR
jgi:hypothetical protein